MTKRRADLDLEPDAAASQPPQSAPPKTKTSRVTGLSQPRALPSAWLDRLLTATTDAPLHDGPVAAIQHVLCAAGALLPGHDLGVVLVRDGVRVALTSEGLGDEVLGDRMFAGRLDEQVISASQGATLHVAADALGELELGLALRVADVVRMLFRVSDGAKRERALESRVRSLRADLTRTERLASVGQIAAQAAHELNNPLSAVVAYGGELHRRAERRGDADESALVARIVEAAERSRTVARDLVAFARPPRGLEAGVSLVDVVERAVTFSAHALGSDVDVERAYGDELPTLYAASSELTQALVNLLSNAAHALPAQDGRVLISVERRGDDVEITVRDNGHGIPQDLLARVFDPFFTTKPEGEGSGLGLAIVAEIVERHGGAVHAESDGATFTTFTLRLPTRASR